ncbi:MAG: GNAT family N-acetyltransferase [Paenisporosarcina sp.]
MSFPVLETKRLKLIELNPSHAIPLFDQFSREDVTRYYGMDPLETLEQAEKMVTNMIAGFEAKRSMRWGIQVKESGEFAGTIGLNNLQLWSKKCEVGYDLHPDYWGTGYIKEALGAVLTYCFEELNLSRVGATTFPANEASWKLLLKVGFEKEGLLRNYLYQGSQNHDAYVFSITIEEWKLLQG